jgi:hypothetical protein
MKCYIVKYENAICCEKCKAQSILDHAEEDQPVAESDFQYIPSIELADSVYCNTSMTCCYCADFLDDDGTIQAKIDAENKAYVETYEELDAWLNNQRR